MALRWLGERLAQQAERDPQLGKSALLSNKGTGAPLGSFKVNYPHALAIDALGNLWVAHEDGAITVSSQDGQPSVPA